MVLSKMIVLINYADNSFKKQQKFSTMTAKLVGGFKKIIQYGPENIEKDYLHAHKDILGQKRGGGYWLWKPYFIVKTLKELKDNDYLFYCDSGAFFIRNIKDIVCELEQSSQDIVGFELPLIEKQWTKKELFINMKCESDQYKNSNQIMGSFILIKKTQFSLNFFEEYLKYSENIMNITDNYDLSISQDEEFIDHRHDQSIFSLLYKKYKLKPFKDPSQYGEFPERYAGVDNFMFEPDKLYKLPNGRYFIAKTYSNSYNTKLLLVRRGSRIRYLLSYSIRKIIDINK